MIGKTVVKMWTIEIDDKAREQIKNLASLPFVHHHIAVMPDCHGGKGMPIGGVLPTTNVVIPNAVALWHRMNANRRRHKRCKPNAMPNIVQA